MTYTKITFHCSTEGWGLPSGGLRDGAGLCVGFASDPHLQPGLFAPLQALVQIHAPYRPGQVGHPLLRNADLV